MLKQRLRFNLLLSAALLPACAPAQTFSQQGSKLVGTGAVFNNPVTIGSFQGFSVALSSDGNTALLGAPNDANAMGAAWVFVRNGITGSWTQQGSKLVGSGATGYQSTASPGTQLGFSVALSADGNTALLGGPGDAAGTGAAWVFTRGSDGTWTQQGGPLLGGGSVNSPTPAQQGSSVALSADGNTALIGGTGDNNRIGAVWVFTRGSDGAWAQQGSKLVGTGYTASQAGVAQGSSVALSGDGKTAASGGPQDNNAIGAVWTFVLSNGNWAQRGSKLAGNGGAANGLQGTSVALSGDGSTLLEGGPGANGAWVFTRDNAGNWSAQGGELTGTGQIGNANQGKSVALSNDGNTALLGGPDDNFNVGAGWVFTRDTSGNWNQLGNKLVGVDGSLSPVTGIRQGYSVALSGDGNTGLLGGPYDAIQLGAAWPFARFDLLFSEVPGSLIQLSVGADGSVWGVNGSQQIYNYNFTTASWTNIPGALVQIAVGSNTAVWGINAQQQIYRWDAVHSRWIQVPGSLTQIAVGADGDAWGLNAETSIYHYDAQSGFFREVPGNLTQITVGSAGAVYGVNTDGAICWYNPGKGLFELITNAVEGTPLGFTQISAGVDGELWAVKGYTAYHYDVLHNTMDSTSTPIGAVFVGYGAAVFGLGPGEQIYEWDGASAAWVQIPGDLRTMSVGANGSVWGINSSMQVFQFQGPTRQFQIASVVPGYLTRPFVGVDGTVWGVYAYTVEYFNPETQTFQPVAGAPALGQLSVSARGNVWGVDGGGNIYQYDPDTATWNNIPGDLTQVEVAAKGSVWGINFAGMIYTYDAEHASWINVPGQLSTLSLGADGTVWGINPEGQIWRYNTTTQPWINVPGALVQISVGDAANVWGINMNQQVYRYDFGKQAWDFIPNIALTGISVAFDGSVWGVDGQSNLHQWNSTTQTFNSIPMTVFSGDVIPSGSNVSVGNSVAVWATNPWQIVYSWF